MAAGRLRRKRAGSPAGLAPILSLVLFVRFTLAPPTQNFSGRSAGTVLSLLIDPHR